MKFSILYQDQNLIAINKPSGFHVHPPERAPEKVPRSKIVLHQLRNQVGQKLFPIHRLDVATSGVLLFALNSEAAGQLCSEFQKNTAEKLYWAVVRGHMPAEGIVDIPLESDSSNELLTCR